MPLPKTKNVAELIKLLKIEKPNISKKQRIAIALSQARKSGANIPTLSEALKKRMRDK